MVYLTVCPSCVNGDHKNCEVGQPAPPGVFGGWRCKCNCRCDGFWKEDPELALRYVWDEKQECYIREEKHDR